VDGQMQGVLAISTIFFVAINTGSSIVESPSADVVGTSDTECRRPGG
jgi:hypothetical protein